MSSTPYNSDGSGSSELTASWSKIPWIFRLGSNHEMSQLKDFILEDERVVAIASGRYGKGRGLVTLTDRRILFTYNGYIRSSSEDVPLKNITSIQRTHAMFKSRITVANAGSETVISSVYYGGRNFVRQARGQVERARAESMNHTGQNNSGQYQPSSPVAAAPVPAAQGSLEERLTRLNTLFEQGLVNEDEYRQQRQTILGLL